MSIPAKVLIGLVALEHVYIMWLEMFRWTHPRTQRAFAMTEEAAHHSKVLAANQGLYNGFIAAGLIWSLLAQPEHGVLLAWFFLGCVLIAGVYGGFTASRRIWVVQALPALCALAVLWLT